MTIYNNSIVGGINRIVSDFRPNEHYSNRDESNSWVEILGAGGPAKGISVLQQLYNQILREGTRITAVNQSEPRPQQETFQVAAASTRVTNDGVAHLDPETKFLYVKGREYFEIHLDELLEHDIDYIPETLRVRIH
jgi:hypothetical protein